MPETMQYSDAVPHGSAGLVNQGQPSTVEQVGAEYAAATQNAVTAAMSKRGDDWAALTSSAPSAVVEPGGYTA